MNRAGLVTLTRSILADSSGAAFPPALVNLRLNTAYAWMQHCVDEIAPDEFITLISTDVVANQAGYQRPSFERLRRYEWKLDDGSYAEIEPVLAEQAMAVHGVRSKPVFGGIKWHHEGQQVFLTPTPTASRTAGLGAAVVDVVELAVDTDVPRLPAALHEFVALGAAVRILGDESRDAAAGPVDRLRRRWESLFPDSPTDDTRRALKAHYRRAQALALS